MISAIILAAGESRRMGVQNKLLLQIDSEVLIQKCVKSVSNSLVDAVLVVVGFEAEKIKFSISLFRIKILCGSMYDKQNAL